VVQDADERVSAWAVRVDSRSALRAISTAAKALGMSGSACTRWGTHLPRTCSRPVCHCIPSRSYLGRSSVVVTEDVYGHAFTEGARPAVERLSAAMGWW